MNEIFRFHQVRNVQKLSGEEKFELGIPFIQQEIIRNLEQRLKLTLLFVAGKGAVAAQGVSGDSVEDG